MDEIVDIKIVTDSVIRLQSRRFQCPMILNLIPTLSIKSQNILI